MLAELAVRKAILRDKPYKISDGGAQRCQAEPRRQSAERCWQIGQRWNK